MRLRRRLLRLAAARWSVRLWLVACLSVLSGGVGVAGLPGVGEVQAARLEGQHFDDQMVLGDRTLRLNGLGLRGVAWIKAFVAGLYLAAPTQDAAQALAMQGPKRLRMKVMLEAGSHEYAKALGKGVRRNESERVQAQLADRLGAFIQTIEAMGMIREGDTIDLDYVPGVGTQLRWNQRAVGQPVPGEDFYRALLKVYIGERPADKKLKQGLLRGGAS